MRMPCSQMSILAPSRAALWMLKFDMSLTANNAEWASQLDHFASVIAVAFPTSPPQSIVDSVACQAIGNTPMHA